MMLVGLLTIVLLWQTHAVVAMCPAQCSGHGTCDSLNHCTCFEGYTGFDCSDRQCPFAAPWSDFATANDEIRTISRECSNRGHCDRNSGRCQCQVPFTGAACERLSVCGSSDVAVCSGHGKCRSLRDVGAMRNDYNLLYDAVYTTPWDADRIFGCVCDYGYTGVDCSLRECPMGDDPITTGQVDEIQALSCLCNGCAGSFTLSFRGQTTRALDVATETAASLQEALEALLTIRSVSVTLDGSGSGIICDTDGVSAMITFTHEHGDVPALNVKATGVTGGTSSVTIQSDGATAAYGTQPATQTGTKEVGTYKILYKSID